MRRHPPALRHLKLAPWAFEPAESLRQSAKDREQVRASATVTHRQKPSTATGVIVATLGDETGTVNVKFCPSVAAAQPGGSLLSIRALGGRKKSVRSR